MVSLGRGVEVPCIRVAGAADGPHVTVVSGVHGAEYCSIAGVRELMRGLEPGRLAGQVTAVTVASPTSFWSRLPFVTPEDGKNLNRVFPGDPGGTFADALAYELFERFVRGSDYLVHVHGGSTMEYVEPFVGYDTGRAADVSAEVEQESRALALAYGLRYVLRSERVGPRGSPTMLRTAAAEAGIPALLTEAGDQGLLERRAVDLHVRGLTGVLRRLAMLPGGPPEPEWDAVFVNSFVPVPAARDGWWEPLVSIGASVARGDDLGGVFDLFGHELERVRAPVDGVCLVLTTSPAAASGSVLLYLGTDLSDGARP